MTYRPLFADIGSKLYSVYSGSKLTPSNELKLFDSKKNNDKTGFDSDAGPSLGRSLRGQQSDEFQDLNYGNADGNLHDIAIF